LVEFDEFADQPEFNLLHRDLFTFGL